MGWEEWSHELVRHVEKSKKFVLPVEGTREPSRHVEGERGRSGFTEDGLILLAAVWMPGGRQDAWKEGVLSEQDPPLRWPWNPEGVGEIRRLLFMGLPWLRTQRGAEVGLGRRGWAGVRSTVPGSHRKEMSGGPGGGLWLSVCRRVRVRCMLLTDPSSELECLRPKLKAGD